jgi:DNA-binding transcriptional LysR family regulator
MAGPKTSLDQWRTLQAVVDEGGFAQAADALHRSQSSVSYAIDKLEESLGVPVLKIVGRKAQLTEAGAVLLARSRHLLKTAMVIEQLAGTLEQGWEAELQLVVDAAFPTRLMIAALKEFAPLSQGCRVQLREVVLSGADEALAAGNADLVIGYQVPVSFLGNPLVDIEFVAVAHPDHPLHKLGRQLTMEDLEQEMQVVVRDSGVRQPVDRGWLGAQYRWTVSSVETSVTTISNGLGFGWLPCHHVEEKIASGLLKPLPLREGGRRSNPLYLIPGKPGTMGPAARQLVEILNRVCGRPTASE